MKWKLPVQYRHWIVSGVASGCSQFSRIAPGSTRQGKSAVFCAPILAKSVFFCGGCFRVGAPSALRSRMPRGRWAYLPRTTPIFVWSTGKEATTDRARRVQRATPHRQQKPQERDQKMGAGIMMFLGFYAENVHVRENWLLVLHNHTCSSDKGVRLQHTH